ncbi:MAG: hypothetical protein AAFV69_03320 [Pseudomonadota bacterium]
MLTAIVYAVSPWPFAQVLQSATAMAAEPAKKKTTEQSTDQAKSRNLPPKRVKRVGLPPGLLPLSALPDPVLEMRDAILEAVASGNIEDLRLALEWNELRPDLGIGRKTDAIANFKQISALGDGLETLAVLGTILNTPPAKLPVGRDFENNAIYVWPGLSEMDLKSLSSAQKVQLHQLMPTTDALQTIKSHKWHWYRLAIGADGTWHVFKKND